MAPKCNILRLSIAVIAFAIPLAVFQPKELFTIGIVLNVGTALAATVILVKRNQVWPLVRLAMFAALGTMLAGSMCPAVDPPYNPGDEFRYMLFGCALGCIVGIAWSEVCNARFRIDETQPGDHRNDSN